MGPWEIFAYGDTDILTQVFNAVAMLMNSGDYLVLVKIMAMIGFLAIFISGLTHDRFGGFKWFIAMMFSYMVFFVPKVDVLITDRMNLSGQQLISNVPFGMAVFGHITSKIGDWLARSFDSVFTIPGPMQYTANGMLFGSRIIQETRLADAGNQRLSTNVYAFIHSCTYYDIVANRIDPNQLRNASIGAGDAWSVMSNTSGGLFVNYINANNNTVTTTCTDDYTRLTADINDNMGTVWNYLGAKLYPKQPIANAVIQAQTDVPVVYNALLNTAAAANDIMRQNLVLNYLMSAGTLAAAELGDSANAQLQYATAQARATAKVNYGTMANLAKEAMPLIRNTIEVIIYAIFPLTFLLMMMPVHTAVTAMKGFAMGLLWVQLWAPLFAVLNMIATLKTGTDLGATMGQNLSLQSALDISAITINNADIAGYLVMSIPIIALAIVKGGEMLLANAAGAAAQPVSGAASGAAGQVATGNLAVGNVNYDNWSAHKHDDSFLEAHGFSRVVNGYGQDVYDSNGRFISSTQSQSSTAAALSYSEREQAAIATKAGESWTRAAQEGYSIAHQYSKSDQAGTGASTSTGSKEAQQYNKLGDIAEQINERYHFGKGSQKGWQAVFNASAGVGIPFTKVQVGGGYRGDRGEKTTASSAEEYAKTAMEREGISDAREVVKNFQQSAEFKSAQQHQDSRSNDFTNGIRVAEGYQREYNFAKSVNAGLDQNATTDAWRWAVENKIVNASDVNKMSVADQAKVLQQYKEEVIEKRFVGSNGWVADSLKDMAGGDFQVSRNGVPMNTAAQRSLAEYHSDPNSGHIQGAPSTHIKTVGDNVTAGVKQHMASSQALINDARNKTANTHMQAADKYTSGANDAVDSIDTPGTPNVVQHPFASSGSVSDSGAKKPDGPPPEVPK